MTTSFQLLQDVLRIESFRVLLCDDTTLDEQVRCPILYSTDAIPEHRQVQLILTPGTNTDILRELAPRFLPGLLDGLTIRDLRTGQALVPFGTADDWAKRVSDMLLPEITLHLSGETGNDQHPNGYLRARMLYRLPDESGIEETVLDPISDTGLSPEEAITEILDCLCLTLEHQTQKILNHREHKEHREKDRENHV